MPPIARLVEGLPESRDLERNLISWLLGCAMVYAALFDVGELCLQQPGKGIALLAVAAVCAWRISREISRQPAEIPRSAN